MKRLIIFIFFVYCTFSISPCYSQWYQISIPVTGQIYKMQFINQNTGWANVITSNFVCALIRTTNQGTNWSVIYSDSAKVETFQFINDTLGYSIGEDHEYHLISRTTNRGYNWTVLISSYSDIHGGFYMVNADTGWVNAFRGLQYVTMRTTNGFQTVEDVSTGAGGTPCILYFFGEKFNNNHYGLILGAGGLWRTTNSGFNWQTISVSEPGSVNNFSFINKDTGWVVYNPNIGNNTKIFFTSNSGQNWVLQYYYGLNYTIGQLQAINKNKIWCGFVNYILISTDGGNSWGHQSCQILSPYGLLMVDSLVGFTWSSYNTNNLARTTNGGGPITQISNNNEQIPDNFILYQNFPNPFNSVSSIKYKIKRRAGIKLVVFDIRGKEIETLINKQQNSGEYSVKFDASNLASGIYFYSLFADGIRVDTKKLVLLK